MATAVEADDPSSSPREGGSARAGSRQSDAGSESPTMPVWAQRLPCCLQAPIKRLYVDLLLPGDSFDVSMRKLLVAMGPIIFFTGPFAVGIGLPISGGLDSSGSWLMFVTLMLWGPLWFGLYFRARCNKARGGDGIMGDLWAGVTAVGLAILSIGMPTGPWHVASAEAVLFAFMIRAPRRWVIAIIGFATAMISIYNQQAFSIGTVELPLIAIPDQYIDGRAGVRHLWQYVVYLVMVPLCGLLEAVSRESERRQEAAKDSLDLATLLAAALSRYDTAAAAEAIATARSGASQVDETLLDEFASIVRNLDEYKPHLPNWLISRHSKTDSNLDGEEENDDDDELDVGGSFRRGRLSLGASTRSHGASDQHSHTSSTSRHRRDHEADDQYRSPVSVPAQLSAPAARSVRAVAAELDVAFGDISRQPGRQTTALLHAFVDRVYRVANETRAAVHTFVGDTVVASWNAATNTAQPEVKAARFASRLCSNMHRSQSLEHSADVNVTGAILSGHAVTLVAGLGDQRSLALSFAPDRVQVHRQARQLARERDVVLIPSDAAKAASFAVTSMLAAVLPAPAVVASPTATDDVKSQAKAPCTRVYHAILGEHSEGEGEWMYVLQDRDDRQSTAAALAHAEELCAAGNAHAALAFLTVQHQQGAFSSATTAGGSRASWFAHLATDLRRLVAAPDGDASAAPSRASP